MPYLTPNVAPTEFICRALFIPNDLDFLAIITGAIQELTFAYNFEKYGALTPEQTSEMFTVMFDKFCFNEGMCRVIGEIIEYAGSASPNPSWLVCDGSEVSQATYPDLYTVIGATYGSASAGMFRLPDLRGRSMSGTGTGTGLTAVSLGQEYGEENHVLTVGELAEHHHAYDPVVVGDLDLESPGVPQPNAAQIVPLITENTYDTGNNEGHNTVGPRLGVTMLIVAR